MKLAAVSPVRDRLADILATWKTWPLAMVEPPKIIKPLAEGTTNHSYLIEINCRNNSSYSIGLPLPPTRTRLCLRVNSEQSWQFGIDRNWEQTVLNALKPMGLAPNIRYRDKAREFTLFDYVDGRTWTRNDFARLSQREKLLEQIKAIQHIGFDAPRYDYSKHIEHYDYALAQRGVVLPDAMRAALSEFKQELNEFMQMPWRPVLCHHDLIPENIMETDQGIVLLDWEYAGLGHPEFDKRYMRQCISSTVQRSPETLLKGDTLDKLIYWLATLWHKLNNTL